MALDGITVSNIVRELNEKIAGSHIARIGQPEPDEIMLTLKSRAGQMRLLMSASASLPLIYLTDKNKMSPMTAPNFCMLLRKHIGSGKIIRVRQPSLERVIYIEIEHYDELGDLRRKNLILELMGKYSNLIFCDENGMILDSIKHISMQISSVREVLPGREYFIPQTQDKYDPLRTDREEFCEKVFSRPLPLSKALYSTYTGLSPVIAEELCFRASIESDQSAREIPEGAQLHLYRIFDEMMNDVKEGRFSPCIIYEKLPGSASAGDPENFDEAGAVPREFASVPLRMYADLPCRSFSSISELLETYYAEKNAATRIRQKSADLRHVVSTILEREAKKLDLQQRQMKDTEKKDKYRIYGELLHTYGYSVQPGEKSVTVQNYYDENKELKIPLDPQKSASENAQKYFDRYNKLKRTSEALTDLIGQTRAAVDQLESIRTFLDQAQSEADLAQIRQELVQSDYIRAKGKDSLKQGKGSGRKGASRTAPSKPYHYRTADGYDIYVGKNNLQNDELTFKFANANDWWFHAKKIPGSHVVVRLRGESDMPDSVFEAAASLAAYYSKNRASDKVEVDYVRRREVKKPNGSKPGFVVYYTNYSMLARPSLNGLEEIND